MLWTKESNKNNALYVDAFSFKSLGSLNREYSQERKTAKNISCAKSDTISRERRLDGNQSFVKDDWLSASGLYNDSLCYAEPGSENISLAYANRSACFLHLKKYAQCLVDIELAESAGYPAHLMPKLQKRKADCLKLIEEGAQEPDDRLKLSFEADKNFPCMVNVLKIEKNAKGNLIMVAKEDIGVGKTIAAEKSFATCLYSKFGWRCNICMKEDANLKPCNKCNVAMFCSNECQASLIHEYECGQRFCRSTQTNGAIMNEMRMIFKAIEMFPNIDELMAFVEQAVQGDQKEIPQAFLDEKSKYRAFLKLPVNPTNTNKDDFWLITFCTYRMLMDMPKMNAMFKAKRHNRFLIHLIMQHVQIMSKNSIRIRLCSVEAAPRKRTDVCTHTGMLKGYFEHSCAPNVLWIDNNGYSLYITTRPVKKGEQLFVTMFDLLSKPKAERQRILWEQGNFLCVCSLCTGPEATPEQRKQLLSDPLYRSGGFDCLDKCATILQKHGHGPLCKEMKNLLDGYCMQLRFKYTNSTNIRAWAEIVSDSLSDE
ncbi:uncharacterized protein LOC129565611 [Sitodiplosis mosellana]|uniref:uncharacterized protein LOC129565611 n=1 Tax=Sitodiplosis mosellana TaxID=263140 RepID=UPI002443E074|nr:uncharacterized protein LOC129565611 [Sitodiplosis mosellana]